MIEALETKLNLIDERVRTLQGQIEGKAVNLVRLTDLGTSCVLNIGGTPFTTDKQVLLSEPGSLFCDLFSGKEPIHKLSDGSIFIGKSPNFFRTFLHLLPSFIFTPSPFSFSAERFQTVIRRTSIIFCLFSRKKMELICLPILMK